MTKNTLFPFLHLGRLIDRDARGGIIKYNDFILSVMVPLPPGTRLRQQIERESNSVLGEELLVFVRVFPETYAGISIDNSFITLTEEELEGVRSIRVELILEEDLGDRFEAKSNVIDKDLAQPDVLGLPEDQLRLLLIKPHLYMTRDEIPPQGGGPIMYQFSLQVLLPLVRGLQFASVQGPFHDINLATTFVSVVFKDDPGSDTQIIHKKLEWQTPWKMHKVTVHAIQDDPQVSGSTTTQSSGSQGGGL